MYFILYKQITICFEYYFSKSIDIVGVVTVQWSLKVYRLKPLYIWQVFLQTSYWHRLGKWMGAVSS